MKSATLRMLTYLLVALRESERSGGSWDSYLDNLIGQSKDATATPQCDSAVIIGLDGGGKWTTDASPYALSITTDETVNIAKCFKSKDFTAFMNDDVLVGGQTYPFLREEDGKVVYAKKKGSGAITLQASKTAIVIAHTPEGAQQGNCNKGVAVIAEYLESLGL